jgi:glycosyltransferase involved in cell wall biosynthesis
MGRYNLHTLWNKAIKTGEGMRIGIDARCLEWSRGGVSRYLVNMLQLWPKMTAQHKFILYFQNKIPEDDFLRHPFYELKLLKGPELLRSRRIVAEQILMPGQLRKDNLDLFFAAWYTSPLLYSGIKTVVAAWDISYSTHPAHYSWWNRISLGYFSRRSCQRAAGVVTCSVFDAQQIENHYKVPEDKILTVHLSADDRFSPERNEEEISVVKVKYKLPRRFILSLGVIHNRRNVDLVIKAFEQLKDEFPDFSLVVIGRNNTQPFIDIEGMMRPMVSEGRAVYMPWFDDQDLPGLYQAADYYVCTSTVDGETIMLKEAMKAGTAVITSPLLEGTIGGNGLIISDPESLVDTVATFRIAMGNDAGREERITKGLEWNKQFTWNRVAKESMQFLESASLTI